MLVNVFKENITRWLIASIHDHFATNISDLHIYFEGYERDTRNKSSYVEIRENGPNLQEESKDNYYIYIEINGLVQSVEIDSDRHIVYADTGKVAKAFTKTIPVYRYGDRIVDDQSFLGCLKLIQANNDNLRITQHGRIAPNTPIQQATVEAGYEMNLCLNEI